MLPPWIGRLTSLDWLSVGNSQYVSGASGRPCRVPGPVNRFSELPEELSALTGLRVLKLNHNPLPALPDWIRETS